MVIECADACNCAELCNSLNFALYFNQVTINLYYWSFVMEVVRVFRSLDTSNTLKFFLLEFSFIFLLRLLQFAS